MMRRELSVMAGERGFDSMEQGLDWCVEIEAETDSIEIVWARIAGLLRSVDMKIVEGVRGSELESAVPPWFRNACASPRSEDEVERELRKWRALSDAEKLAWSNALVWELDEWLHSMLPENRSWFVASAKIVESRIRCELIVDGYPFACGALHWMIRAAGGRVGGGGPDAGKAWRV